MSKKRAKLRFVWISLLVALGLFFAVVPFKVPFTAEKYNSLAGSFLQSAGFDILGGESVVYDCQVQPDQDIDKSIESTLQKLDKVLNRAGFGEAQIKKQGQQIRIDVKSADKTFFSDWLANGKKLSITLYPYDNALSTVCLESKHISDAAPTYRLKEGTQNEAEYGINLTFTAEGSRILKDYSLQASKASSSDEKKLYIYSGDVQKGELVGTIDCSKQITSSTVFVESDDMLSSYSVAVENAYNIVSGTFDVTLDYVGIFEFAPTLGENTMLLIAIAAIVAIVLIMVLLYVRYGDFGLLSSFAFVVFSILMLFFLQSIPLISLSLPTIVAILISMAMFVDSNIIILERIKQEYAAGKKVPLAVKGGFKRAFWPILDSHVAVAVISLVVYFFGSSWLKSLAFPLFVGALVSFFTSMVITRFFIKSYLPLNSTNIKKLRLHREKGVVEIKEDEDKKPSEDQGINILAQPAPEDKTGGEN